MTSLPSHDSRVFWNILKLSLAVLLAGFVLSRTNMSQLMDLFKSISFGWLIFSVFLFLVITLLKALQYYVLISGKMTYHQILNVVILQNAVSNFLASSAGIASYLAALRVEHDVKVSRSVVVFLLTKIGDLVALWLALVVSGLLVWGHIGVLHNLIVILLAGIGLVILVFFFTFMFRQRFLLLLKSILDWLKLSQVQFVQKGLGYLQSLAEIEPGRLANRLVLVILLSLVYFVASVVWSYATFLVFNLRMSIPEFVFINVLIQLVSYFPIQIFGGLGVSEASGLYFWGIFGIAPTVLAPVLIGSRILFYLLNLVPLIYLPLHVIFFDKKRNVQDE